MSNFNLKETTVPTLFCQDLNVMDLEFDSEAVIPFFESIMLTIGSFLGSIKDKENPTAVTIDNARDELELGAIVKYFPGEEGSKGSWALEFTFDSADLADAKIISFNSGNIDQFLRSIAGTTYGLQFNTTSGLRQSIIAFAQNIKKWLDANASETEKNTLELPGFFKASVKIVNGEKEFGFEAAEEISQKVKFDAGEEK